MVWACLLQKVEDTKSKSQSYVWRENYDVSGPLDRSLWEQELRSRKPSALASACPSVWVTGTIALATHSSKYPDSFRDTKIIMGTVSFLFVTRLHQSVDQTFGDSQTRAGGPRAGSITELNWGKWPGWFAKPMGNWKIQYKEASGLRDGTWPQELGPLAPHSRTMKSSWYWLGSFRFTIIPSNSL